MALSRELDDAGRGTMSDRQYRQSLSGANGGPHGALGGWGMWVPPSAREFRTALPVPEKSAECEAFPPSPNGARSALRFPPPWEYVSGRLGRWRNLANSLLHAAAKVRMFGSKEAAPAGFRVPPGPVDQAATGGWSRGKPWHTQQIRGVDADSFAGQEKHTRAPAERSNSSEIALLLIGTRQALLHTLARRLPVPAHRAL